MATLEHIRQHESREDIKQISNTTPTVMTDVIKSIDKELQPPFRMRQDTGSNRVLYVDDYIVTNTSTNKSHVVTPIDGLLPTISFPFTITFPSAPAGTITSSITINTGATLPSWTSTHYLKVGIAVNGTGQLLFTYGTAAATISAATPPALSDFTANIGYIVLQNNAGTISNITNSVIYQYASSGSGSGSAGYARIFINT
jgi:hypothetical protein